MKDIIGDTKENLKMALDDDKTEEIDRSELPISTQTAKNLGYRPSQPHFFIIRLVFDWL